MTEALRWAGFAVLAALAAFSLRAVYRQAGAAAALAAGIMLFYTAVTQMEQAVNAMETLAQKAGVGSDTVQLLIRLVGMAYVTEFAVEACRDAGENGLAAKASLCGKMLLMLQTLPLVMEIGELALTLSP